MSGIMGIYHLDDSPVERENLVKMVDILAHRGPDGADIWIEGAVGFGHRMLWTTPESLIEKLPLVNRTGDVTITADCRIDNREELISIFQFDDCPPEKITDSQLILAAYEKWGEQCPEHLLGDFAFAIWDKREQKLFCARDHFGVKPFYYYKNEFFTFATEIKALLCVPGVPRVLNPVRIGDYLADIYEDNAITFYQNILRLPPAHSMVVNQLGVQIKSYWSLDRDRELLLDSDEEYAAKFREIFAEAVHCRLRSAFPVGSMLSGGLDSSSITCMARKILTENNKQALHTYSAVFDDVPESDESPYIKAVEAQGGTVGHYLHADQVSPLTDLEQVLWHLDEPIFAGNLYINWNIYSIAKNQNIRIMLDGFDGDNTVSHGVGYLSELALAGRWLTLCWEIQGYAKNFKFSFWQILWQHFYNYGFKRLVRKYKPLNLIHKLWQAGSKRLWRTNIQAQPQNVILNSTFVEKISLEQRHQNFEQVHNLPQHNQRHHHYKCVTAGVLPYTLETLDHASAGFGIELRYPFWDKRLVEFCLSIPANQKMSQGWTRAVLRRGMAGFLPQEVQWRGGKGNLSYGFDRGLLKFERGRLEQMLTQELNLIEEYINKKTVTEACQKFISQQSHDDDATVTWKALDLSLWLNYMGFNS